MSPAQTVKLGELLIRAGILTAHQLLESIELAKQTSTPIGRMLVMCGTVSESVLHAAVQLQSMLRENEIDLDSAVTALELVNEGTPLAEATALTGRKVVPKKPTIKLGEILVECGFLLPEELDKFLKDSLEAGLPLGRTLVLYGTLSKESLSACLTAQVLVRDRKVTRSQAIKALTTMRRRRLDLETALRELGYYRQPMRPHTLIGELCIQGGLIDDGNVLSALETALENEVPVGQAMIQKGLLTRADLEIALELQEMVVNKTLTESQAAEVLNKVSQKGFAPTLALTELAITTANAEDTKSAWQLLTASGTIGKDVRHAIFHEAAPVSLAELGQKLLQAELIDEFTLHNAFRCQFLMRSGFLALEQAIVVLNHCRSRRISADTALKELNWIAETKMKLDSAV